MERSLLDGCRLFDGLMLDDIMSLCGCLGARRMLCGGRLVTDCDSIVLLVSGSAAAGGRTFVPGEALAVPARCPVATANGSELIIFSAAAVSGVCGCGCPAHRRLAANAMAAVFDSFASPIGCLDVRRRVAAVLLVYGGDGESFRLPLTRDQLAECLGCPRSELVRELEKLRSEKIIFYNNRDFTLENRVALQKASEG